MIPVLDLPDRVQNAEVAGWKQINEGCSRRVFVHSDNPAVVLKIGEAAHNEIECDLWESFAESAFSFSFTPILGRNENYSAILMKRMVVFEFGEVNESMRRQASQARARVGDIWEMLHPERMKDFHVANWAFIQDDYGYFAPGSLVDYAGC